MDSRHRTHPAWFVLLWLVTTLSSVAQPYDAAQAATRPNDAAAQMQARRAVLGAARSWAYQLRINDLGPLARDPADVLVIDHGYAAKRNGKIMFDATDVAKLKIKPDGRRRTVLAYMSIGEAEQYRFYWQGAWCRRLTAPRWIGTVNPIWPGNYPTRFWDPEWQKLILDPADGYLARIQSQGFDGVYLDRTDVYAEWLKERPGAEADMITFLDRIATAARERNGQFLIVMQNAEELLVHRRVRLLLDGMAKEDLLFGLTFTEAANDAASVTNSLQDLKRARADRMPVFAVEYLADPAKISAARERLLGFGFVPYFAPRLLDTLMQQGPYPPRLPDTVASPTTAIDPAPAPTGPAATTATPGPSWAEGGPTCLLD